MRLLFLLDGKRVGMSETQANAMQGSVAYNPCAYVIEHRSWVQCVAVSDMFCEVRVT